MLWSESCCRKTLQPLPLHSSIVCTGSLFTPESVSNLPQSLTSPNGQNLSYTLLPCGTNICQSETSVHPIHCFFLPTRQKKFRLACFSFCCTNYLEQISTIHQNCTFHSIVQSPPLKLIIFSTLLDWPRDRADSLATLRFVCTLYYINCYCHCQNPSFHLFKYFLNVLTSSEAIITSGSSFNLLIIL